jgi:hypothetical protein
MCSVQSDFSVDTDLIAMRSVDFADADYGGMHSNDYVHERCFYTSAPTDEQNIVQRDSFITVKRTWILMKSRFRIIVSGPYLMNM